MRTPLTSGMAIALGIAAALLGTAQRPSARSQAGPTAAVATAAGTWRAEFTQGGQMRTWTAVLRVTGSRIVGAVSSCASNDGTIEIVDGRITGTAITFRCTSLDGDRTLTFHGTVDEDQIAFTWDKAVVPDGNPASVGLFGASTPRQFTARRAPDADNSLARAADLARARIPEVTFGRLLHADREPQNWLTYSRTLGGQRYSPLTQISRENVKDLELAWIWQAKSTGRFEATPLVVDGVMYTVQPPNDVVALDAATGRELWMYHYAPARRARASGGGGRINRGVAILGGTLFLGTLDAHLLAIDAYSGTLLWDTTVADAYDPSCGLSACYVITHAPLVIKDKVLVGVGGGEGPTRGFLAAFDATTGKAVWRFNTIPAPGEPGHDTWSGDSWKIGGAGIWNTGAYDPELNLTYWGVGNPNPNNAPETRLGDNLYSDSVVALDADTGALRWHYQFTPHDTRDWDSAQVPVLTDLEFHGRLRKVMLWANRNGLVYILDRTTGEFLIGKPFVPVTWMRGFDTHGRPIRNPPAIVGATPQAFTPTNWMPPSYSVRTGLFYFSAWEREEEVKGGRLRGGPSHGAVRAFDPITGEERWEFKVQDAIFSSGTLTTASDLLFAGTTGDFYAAVPPPEAIAAGADPSKRLEPDPARLVDGYFYALDARTGDVLWKTSLAASVESGVMSYAVAGKQYVAVAAGNTLFAFAVRQ